MGEIINLYTSRPIYREMVTNAGNPRQTRATAVLRNGDNFGDKMVASENSKISFVHHLCGENKDSKSLKHI